MVAVDNNRNHDPSPVHVSIYGPHDKRIRIVRVIVPFDHIMDLEPLACYYKARGYRPRTTSLLDPPEDKNNIRSRDDVLKQLDDSDIETSISSGHVLIAANNKNYLAGKAKQEIDFAASKAYDIEDYVEACKADGLMAVCKNSTVGRPFYTEISPPLGTRGGGCNFKN